jgi:hypothetical protein
VTDKERYLAFVRQHRNVRAPKPSVQEHLFELFDYLGQLPPGTSMKRYVSNGFNYGSTGGLQQDNITQPHPQPQEQPAAPFDDLPLFQKP